MTPRRRRHVLAVGAVGAVCASLAGCPALLSDPFRIDADAGEEGGAPADDDARAPADATGDADARALASDADGGVADAGPREAGPGAPCCVPADDPLGRSTADAWTAIGTARTFGDFTELTAESTALAGGVFFSQRDPLADFELSFEFSITRSARPDAQVADGLAFVALPSLPKACGDAGSAMCVLGGDAGGFALVVRTFLSPMTRSVPFVGLVATSRGLDNDAGPAFFEGGLAYLDAGVVTFLPAPDAAPSDGAATDAEPPADSWRTLCFRLIGGKASATLDDQPLFANVPLPTTGAYSWGFVGSTGAVVERNAVRRVRWISTLTCGDAARCADAELCGD
jgi:hypothetical protein